MDITGLLSVEGEFIPLKTKIKPADANGSVEKWLVQVARAACVGVWVVFCVLNFVCVLCVCVLYV